MRTFNLGNVPVAQIAGPFFGITNFIKQVGQYLFAFDDDSVVYFADNMNDPGNSFVDIYVVNFDGAFTHYQIVATMKQGFSNYVASILPLSNGAFIVSLLDGSVYHVRVGNLKLNNATPIAITNKLSVSNSCTASTQLHSVYYDAKRKLIAFAWYIVAGQLGAQIYSTIYSLNTDGTFTLRVDGYTGYSCPDCAPPIVDPYDFTASSLPANANVKYSAIGSNGFSGSSFLNNYWSFGGSNTNVNAGNTQYFQNLGADNCSGCTPVQDKCPQNCDCPNGNTISSSLSSYFETSGTQFGSPWGIVDSNIPNFSGLTEQGYPPDVVGMIVTDGINYFTLTPSNGNRFYQPNYACVTKKYLFISGDGPYSGNRAHGFLYVAANPGIVPGNNVAFNSAHPTVNSVRPISLTGAYKS